MESNFKFLDYDWTILYDLGIMAEQNLYNDPNTSIIKLRIYAEKLVEFIYAYEDLEEPSENDQLSKLKRLERKNIVPDRIIHILHSLRKNGNKAVHEMHNSLKDAKILLSLAYKIGVWFKKTYSNDDIEIKSFNLPAKEKSENNKLKELEISYEEKLSQLESKLEEIRSTRKDINTNKSISNIDLNKKEKQKILDNKFDKLMNIYNSKRKFITTAPLNDEKNYSQIWNSIKRAFKDNICKAYWRYPLFNKTKNGFKSPDILVADKNLGILILNINLSTIEEIQSIKENKWKYNNREGHQEPVQNSEDQLLSILNYCDRERKLFRKIGGKAAVILPNISEDEWEKHGLPQLPLIFSNQLNKNSLSERINDLNYVVPCKKINDKMWNTLLSTLTGQNIFQEEIAVQSNNTYTRNGIKGIIKKELHQVDMQQEEIGKTIPPGAQRIRGIAGSGKTILLCQKAAHMHLKHPDWNIALIFFTRSLYDNVISEINKWVEHYSNGEKSYNPEVNKKLQVLHAWGAKDQPGFYRVACHKNNIEFLHAGRSELGRRSPTQKLIKASKIFLDKSNNIKASYDAILIDEAQDLITDDQELKYKDKQPFFWLAYQSLKPIKKNNKRRLIWAYDEAQSLNSLNIPTAPELFGDKPRFKQMVSGLHKGGIKKSEIMSKCYRTPGPILVAAHAMGMGLLRDQGMLTGFTTQEDWENIGYEIKEGSFHPPGQNVVIHRPKETTPNRVPEIWEDDVLNFNTYNSRDDELEALVKNLKYNITVDNLNPSRDILVILLGKKTYSFQQETARYLMNKDIDIYIPKAIKNNQLNNSANPNKFWNKNGITISNIYGAKGNEAYMVHILGLDKVARNESNVSLRNQLFVALTRAKGWVNVSGIGDYKLYNEFQRVINSGRTFSFKFQRPEIEH